MSDAPFDVATAALPIRYARELLVGARIDVAAALDRVGIPLRALDDDGYRITAAQLGVLIHAAVTESDDEVFGCFARPVPCRTLATSVRIGTSCRDVRSFIQAATALYALFDRGHVHWALETTAHHATLLFLPRPGPQRASLLLGHAMLLGPWRMAAWLAQASFPAREVVLPRRFDRYVDEARYFFGIAPKVTSEERYALTFDASMLDARISRSVDEMLAWARGSSFAMMLGGAPPDSIEVRVRGAITSAESFTSATLPYVAKRLGMSGPSLARELRALGTSFQVLKDLVRRDHAVSLLAQGVPVTEVAERLGFSETSAFSRAFKAWTGAPPTHYR